MLNQYTVFYHIKRRMLAVRGSGIRGEGKGVSIISGETAESAGHTFKHRFPNRVIDKIKVRKW